MKTKKLNNLNPLRIVKDTVGLDTFIGIYTNRKLTNKEEQEKAKKEIEVFYNGCYNHGVTAGELHWLHSGFAYFSTDLNRLVNGLVEKQVCDSLWLNPKQDEKTLQKRFLKPIKDYVEAVQCEHFVENLRKYA